MIALIRAILRIVFITATLIIVYFSITYKPYRIFAPSLAPVNCISDTICVESRFKTSEAQRLYREALSFVSREVGEIKRPPRIYFCSTQECSDYFGVEGATGYAVGNLGIVIKPNGWRARTVRHELIHHLQSERLGPIQFYLTPLWFREGMAYHLSGNTSQRFSNESGVEGLRQRFEAWYQTFPKDKIWEEARKLQRLD